MGCPIDIVVNKGAGSALLTKPMRMKSVVEVASGTVDIPITIKVFFTLNTSIRHSKVCAKFYFFAILLLRILFMLDQVLLLFPEKKILSCF